MRKEKPAKREVRRSERQKVMKRKRAVLPIICLVFLLGQNVQAAKPSQTLIGENSETQNTAVDTITKTVRLPAGQVTQIPRYEDAGEILYVLDENSIRIQVTGAGEAEGADVCTFTKTLTDLPDNDLERIPMTMSYQGNSSELLYVIYTVTAWDEYELPEVYQAVCCYGWLEKYWISYDTEWEATMTYLGYPVGARLDATLIHYLYDDEELRKLVETGSEEEKSLGETEREFLEARKDLPNVEIEEEETPLGGLEGWRFPVAAAVAAAGILLFLPVFLWVLTAPLYAVRRGGNYRRIGRVWMKRREGRYEAVLTKELVKKAETQNFMIRVSGYLQKRSSMGVLDIRCPSGEVIRRKMEREVLFWIPVEEE